MTRQSIFVFLRQRFTRVIGSVAYIPQLDGLRALAVLMVIAHHIFSCYLQDTHRLGTQMLPRDWDLIAPRSPVVNWGLHLAFGVQIFFAISGFVLSMPFARAAFDGAKFPSVRLYLLRRLVRLEPPYIVAMTLCLMPWLAWSNPHVIVRQLEHPFGMHYLASITYLHALIFGEASWFNGVSWTLEIEIQFYLLLPLFALLFKLRSATVRRLIFVAIIFAGEFFSRFTMPHLKDPRWALSLPGHLGFFFAGILLADLYLVTPRALRFRPRIADACAVVSGLLIIYVLHCHYDLRWVNPFLVLAFFFGVFNKGLVGRIFSSSWLTVPGVMCYTLYLFHYLILEHCMPFTIRILAPIHSLAFDSIVQFVVLLPVILVFSALLYLGVERPFVVLSHALTRRWRPSARPATPEVSL